MDLCQLQELCWQNQHPHGGPKPLPDDCVYPLITVRSTQVMSRPLTYIFRDRGGDLVIFVDV